ncbi:MAG: hypothetical protein JWO88_2620, partial [Frankiales bacterium]|nr:hypothetical protein [Frankiales bacterium]
MNNAALNASTPRTEGERMTTPALTVA